MSENTAVERELGWDDAIEKESNFILLPEGDYDFKVEAFERSRHNGSEKLPPCNKAIVYIRIETSEGAAVIKHNLFLHSKTEGMLCNFFSGIGQRKKGEKVNMDWSKVVGAAGRAKVGIREWKTDEGEKREMNQIKTFYPKDDSKSYTPGSF